MDSDIDNDSEHSDYTFILGYFKAVENIIGNDMSLPEIHTYNLKFYPIERWECQDNLRGMIKKFDGDINIDFETEPQPDNYYDNLYQEDIPVLIAVNSESDIPEKIYLTEQEWNMIYDDSNWVEVVENNEELDMIKGVKGVARYYNDTIFADRAVYSDFSEWGDLCEKYDHTIENIEQLPNDVVVEHILEADDDNTTKFRKILANCVKNGPDPTITRGKSIKAARMRSDAARIDAIVDQLSSYPIDDLIVLGGYFNSGPTVLDIAETILQMKR